MGAFLQGNELLIILVILLLILGPTKLPALARGLGQAMREFKKASQGLYDEDAIKKDLSRIQARPAQTATTTQSATTSEDEALIRKLAENLGVDQKGKSVEQLREEVLETAKKKGLI